MRNFRRNTPHPCGVEEGIFGIFYEIQHLAPIDFTIGELYGQWKAGSSKMARR
jgi:hypothetical protein